MRGGQGQITGHLKAGDSKSGLTPWHGEPLEVCKQDRLDPCVPGEGLYRLSV